MATFSTPPRTSLRDGNGPRAVDSGSTSSRHRQSGRRHGDEAEKHRPKRRDSHKSSSKRDGHRRRVSSASTPQSASPRIEQPTLELTVVGQPSQGIQLGVPVNASVVVSLRTPESAHGDNADRIDTSRFFGITSLVYERSDGERIPMESGSITGQKTYDSVHDMPADSVRTFERINPDLTVLGYFSFPGLVIRQTGTFRIRTTLARMGAEGASSLTVVDSEPVKVERRGTVTSSSQRRHRMYGS